MKNSKPQLILVVSLVLLITTVVMLVFRDYVYREIVIPLYNAFLILRQLVLSLPQYVFWAVLIIVGLLIALRSLRKKEESVSGTSWMVIDEKAHSRLKYWMSFVNSIDSRFSSTGHFSYDFKKLILSVLADQEHITPEEIEHNLKSAGLEIPDYIRSFIETRKLLESDQSTHPPKPEESAGANRFERRAGWFTGFFQRLKNGLLSRDQKENRLSRREDHLERIIKYMEDQLEVLHDNGNR